MVDRCGGGRAAFVGDSRYDVEAARAAGIPVVVCAFGEPAGAQPALGADAIIRDYRELIATLARLG